MGCVTATARRRRKQMRHDPRYKKHFDKAALGHAGKGRKTPKKGAIS